MERARLRRLRRTRVTEDQPRRPIVPPRGRPTPTHPKETNVIRLPEGSGRSPLDIGGPRDAVTSVCWSRDGEQVFSGSRDGTIRVWSSGNGVQVALLQGHTNTVHAIAISFDGRYIASASSDCTVRLWSVRTFKAVGPPFEHADELYCVTFSPDRKRVACGGKDTKVYLWDIQPYTKSDAGDADEPAPELPLAPSDEDILNELLMQEVAGFLPPLPSVNGILPNMNIPESALTVNWPIQGNNDPPREAPPESSERSPSEIFMSVGLIPSSSKRRSLDWPPPF